MIEKDKEKEIIKLMISLYCKKSCGSSNLCHTCSDLLSYATKRIDLCVKDKTFCSTCPTPCYNPDKRLAIRQVMKFSGPRMIFYHPVIAIKHVLNTIKSKGFAK